MKECMKCGEMNKDNNPNCWKCNTLFQIIEYNGKICPHCGADTEHCIYICGSCGKELSGVKHTTPTRSFDEINAYYQGEWWKYLISALIPIVGIIMAFGSYSEGRKTFGSRLILCVVTSFALSLVVRMILVLILSSVAQG